MYTQNVSFKPSTSSSFGVIILHINIIITKL